MNTAFAPLVGTRTSLRAMQVVLSKKMVQSIIRSDEELAQLYCEFQEKICCGYRQLPKDWSDSHEVGRPISGKYKEIIGVLNDKYRLDLPLVPEEE